MCCNTLSVFGLGELRNIAELLALLSAAGFFIWRLWRGFFDVNAAISVHVDRTHATEDDDYLAISATLRKCGSGSLAIHDARVQLRCGETPPQEHELHGYERLSFRADDREQWRTRIVFGAQHRTSPVLFLSPDEQATFSTYARISRGLPCIVDVAISGQIVRSSRTGQWRSVVVSLPRPDTT